MSFKISPLVEMTKPNKNFDVFVISTKGEILFDVV
jgi:hypothetical protein